MLPRLGQHELLATAVAFDEVVHTTISRAWSKRAETVGATTTTAYYLYDGWNRIAEWSGTSLSKVTLWGLDLSGTTQVAGGFGGLLSILDVGTSVRYYTTNHGNGNVCESINSNLSGTAMLAAHFEYDPFGNLTAGTSGTAATFPYRSSTKPQDPVTGLLYYGYRWYDPLIGRWPSREASKTEGFDFQHALEDAVWSSCMAGACTMGSISDSMAAAMLDHFKSDLLP